MEPSHISQPLLQIVNQQEPTSYSKASSPISTLVREENIMLEYKYKNKPFGKMDYSERVKWSKGLLLKIHVITGWTIPENEFMNILFDQFEKKLYESYPTCNPDEIEYAFRSQGTTVKDWGKTVNLALIDEVMMPYLSQRYEISRIEEQKKNPMIEYKEDLSEIAMKEWWNDTARQVALGKLKMEFIPVALYEWMDKQAGINKTAKEKHEYIGKAVNHRNGTLVTQYERSGSEDDKQALDRFTDMVKQGYMAGDEVDKTKSLAKRMIIYDMMKSNN